MRVLKLKPKWLTTLYSSLPRIPSFSFQSLRGMKVFFFFLQRINRRPYHISVSLPIQLENTLFLSFLPLSLSYYYQNKNNTTHFYDFSFLICESNCNCRYLNLLCLTPQ